MPLHNTLGKRCAAGRGARPMLKILRSIKNESVIVTVVGRIEGESLEEFKRVMAAEGADHHFVLD